MEVWLDHAEEEVNGRTCGAFATIMTNRRDIALESERREHLFSEQR